MTEAAYWLAVLGTRCTAGFPSLLQDPWCLSLLSQVAGPREVNPNDPNRAYVPTNAGFNGWVWTFSDTSQLLANRAGAIILGVSNAP